MAIMRKRRGVGGTGYSMHPTPTFIFCRVSRPLVVLGAVIRLSNQTKQRRRRVAKINKSESRQKRTRKPAWPDRLWKLCQKRKTREGMSLCLPQAEKTTELCSNAD
ncbi:hypothetical protein DdX_03878 [Ditylenchus destructor]|uniref:Uncharacterized protein n=1 Tax=Ditylenchus destructor TaxID=166010 RepID=A0AAD4NFR5_9BILA|nr:hypothetical protein DdX_03878 [Ditylenchus destructor]